MEVKPIKCKCCREKGFPKNNSTIGFYRDKPGCQDARIKKALEKGRAQMKRAVKETNRRLKEDDKKALEKLKTLGEYEIEAKKEFQKWVRLRDKNDGCISCGNTQTTEWDGGHYFKAELYSGLIFHTDNCNKQCKQCNHRLHGNESNYRIGLVKKIGEERVNWLEENKDRLRVYKFTREELIAKRAHYKSLIKILEEK